MGVISGNAVAYGGTPVAEHFGNGARQLVNPDAQLTQSGDWGDAGMTPELDPKFCSERKDDDSQCGARPVRGEKYCIGHLRQHERQSTDSQE